MIYRRIGTSLVESSVIGLGTFPLGGWMWGGVDAREAIKTIHCALDHGINLIDTAPLYGYGLAETLVGKAIAGYPREKVVIATKCGLVFDRDDWAPGEGEHHFRFDAKGISTSQDGRECRRFLRADSIIREAEASLRRLGTDYIDLYFTHAPDATTPIEESLEALTTLKKQGKIRAIGCSNVSTIQLQCYLESGQLDADQERMSLIDQTVIDNGLLDLCRASDVSFFAYSPLENGLLTGLVDPNRKYPPGDLRKDSPRFAPENIEKINTLLKEFEPIAQKHRLTPGQLVIAWIVSQYEKAHVLCGMRSTQNVELNAAAGSVILTAEEITFMTARATAENLAPNDLVFELN